MQLRRVASSLAFGGLVALVVGSVVEVASSCTSGRDYTTAAAVSGPEDMHCIHDDAGVPYLFVQPTSPSACKYAPPPDAFGTTGPDAPSEFGPTMYDSSGRDDKCKYVISWKATEVAVNKDLYFQTVALYNAEDPSAPLTGASPYVEAYLNDNHPAPCTPQAPTEGPPGTYQIGPILFDSPGMWTVRFHYDWDCYEYSPESPHGHAAFYVNVPAPE